MTEGIDIWLKRCPVCLKDFTVLWPSQWAYKRGAIESRKFFCSWKCLRAYDNEKQKGEDEKKMLHLSEKNRKAVEIAMSGGDPVAFLKENGSKNPSQLWFGIRSQLKAKDPETYAKLPTTMKDRRRKAPETPEGSLVDAMAGMKDAVETFFGPIETPEKPKIYQPVNYDGMMVREVEGNFARYRRSDVGGQTYIDVEVTDGCDTLSYTVEQWRNFRKEHDRAAVILGVEL